MSTIERTPPGKIEAGHVIRTAGLGDVKVTEVLSDGLALIVRDARGEEHDVRAAGHLSRRRGSQGFAWDRVLGTPGDQPGLFEWDRPVSTTEVRQLDAELQERGELWNGMTTHHLEQRYPGRLYHRMGHGWFVRPAQA
jgi:hypothetical protein